jgi:hypothetical protein
MCLVFRVQNDSDHVRIAKAKKEPEVVTLTLQQARPEYARCVDSPVLVIHLQECERLLKTRSRDEHHASPMVDEPARYSHRCFAVGRLESAGQNFSPLQTLRLVAAVAIYPPIRIDRVAIRHSCTLRLVADND